MDIIKKPWGQEELLERNEFYVVKRLTMKEGHCCSLQYHNKKHETIYVLDGELLIIHGNNVNELEETILKVGDFMVIAPLVIHRMKGSTDSVYLESSTIELDDVIRLEDNYGRVDEI